MNKTWAKMRRFRIWPWLHMEGAWMALILFGLGCIGFGFSLATMYAQNARTQELQVNFAAFNSALAAKDTLIKTLVGSTVTASGQAVDAVATATKAVGAAADATMNAAAKSKADTIKIDKLKKNQKPRGTQ